MVDMSSFRNYLAIDLGAESGRVILAKFDGEKIVTEELDRFFNEPVLFNGTLYWDILRLILNIRNGINKALKITEGNVKSIGVDTWGVDFGLIGKDGSLLQNPVHYRDKRTVNQAQQVQKKISLKKVFEETGFNNKELSTIFQLNYLVDKNPWLIDTTDKILMIPDLLNYFLAGVKFNEYTEVTTTGIYNPSEMTWSKKICSAIGIPERILPEVIIPGKKIGDLLPEILDYYTNKKIEVISTPSHDTSSAVASTPFDNPDSGFISSGTWSIFGIETDEPIIDIKGFHNSFTNEGGAAKKIIFVKNLTGLWILQNCKKEWQKQLNRSLSWDEIVHAAERSKPLTCLINVDHQSFFNTDDMIKAISEYCRNTNQPSPEGMGSIARCCIESLALRYKETYLQLVDIIRKPLNRMHIIGGGSRNRLLCQATADALGIPVISGPVEATALGNVSFQAICTGDILDINEARKIISGSERISELEPTNTGLWQEAFQKYKKTVAQA